MTSRLAGKTAFVTAAGQGIGRAVALAFVREGARVIATDINTEALATLAAETGCTTLKLDATDPAAISAAAAAHRGVNVLFIVAAASIFGWLLTATRVTDMVAAWVLAYTHSPWVFLLLANLLMLFVGCFLEPTAAILILVPVLMPVVQQLGIDPVHFGLVMVLNLMIGLLHPPMGMVLFVLARVAKLSLERTTMAILPWLVPLLLSLVILTYIPAISLWLPRTMGMQ